MQASIFSFDSLATADLIVDAVYEGGPSRSISADPFFRLLPGVGNQGGFRFAGKRGAPRLVAIYSTLADPNWPDEIDIYTGTFTYFGDNRTPGSDLHETPRGGNCLLRECFAKVHNNEREGVPPFFVFTKGSKGRDIVFRGLAVPSTRGSGDNLVAVWRSMQGRRFQNYRAQFTILDVAAISRRWIEAVSSGSSLSDAPEAWATWVKTGVSRPLAAVPTVDYRTKEEQLPGDQRGRDLMQVLYEHFKAEPTRFEKCAAEIASMLDPNIDITVITRPSRDGGRDAIGEYRVGPVADKITLDFALEAKCYAPDNGVGVKELSRLISRLRHRQFGVLVTTSFLGQQAYQELRDDGHPVIVIAGADIAEVFIRHGIGTVDALRQWLHGNFKISNDGSMD